MMDPEGGEIGADQVEHRRHRAPAEYLQPGIFGSVGIGVAILRRQRLADRLQIVPGIEAFRYVADLPAERFEIAQVRRAGEHVDLRSGVVDIIFAGDRVAGGFEQARQRVTDDGAAAMAHCIGPVGLAETYSTFTRAPRARPRAAVGGPVGEDGAKLVMPDRGLEPDVDEARSRHLGADDLVQRREPWHDQLRQRARIGPGALGQDHRRVGCEVAMRRIARWLHRHGLALEPGRQGALAFESVEDGVEMRGEAGVKGHDGSGFRGGRGLDDVRGDLKAAVGSSRTTQD